MTLLRGEDALTTLHSIFKFYDIRYIPSYFFLNKNFSNLANLRLQQGLTTIEREGEFNNIEFIIVKELLAINSLEQTIAAIVILEDENTYSQLTQLLTFTAQAD